jgi:tRNA (guanine9-N1)-methyltransferase
MSTIDEAAHSACLAADGGALPTEAETVAAQSEFVATPDAGTAAEASGPVVATLSKNQQRRNARYERVKASRHEKRAAERERRKVKRALNHQAHERAMADGTVSDVQLAPRSRYEPEPGAWKLKFKHNDDRMKELLANPAALTIAIDCGYEALMTAREIASLETQLSHSYGANMRAVQPAHMVATGLAPGCETIKALVKARTCIDNWHWRAEPADLGDAYPVGGGRERLVYLCAESETVLGELSPDDVYVIGGLVDHNRLKATGFTRAKELGVRTARLPIELFLPKAGRVRTVLTTVGVYGLLLAKQHMPWAEALEATMPQRWKETNTSAATPAACADADTDADADAGSDVDEGSVADADTAADAAADAGAEGKAGTAAEGGAATEAGACADAGAAVAAPTSV